MTDTEKRMKKYVNAVERRLNLPREVRARVMSDFMSAIQARREAGQTDGEILAELGTPKEAAADLNEQMKEFAYRKSPWRFVFLAMGSLAALGLAIPHILLRFMAQELGMSMVVTAPSSAVGIIGGADGPTAIFLTHAGFDWEWLILIVLCVVGFWGYWRLCRCKRK